MSEDKMPSQRSGVERRQDASPYQSLDRRENIPDRRSDNNLNLVTFRIGTDIYGVDVKRVQEVILLQHMTEVPLADSTIRGLMNLRGQVVPVYDMRMLLGYERVLANADPINIIVTHEEGLISLLVDEQGDYMEINRSYFRPAPKTLEDRLSSRLLGVCELPGQFLIMILDVDHVLAESALADTDS